MDFDEHGDGLYLFILLHTLTLSITAAEMVREKNVFIPGGPGWYILIFLIFILF